MHQRQQQPIGQYREVDGSDSESESESDNDDDDGDDDNGPLPNGPLPATRRRIILTNNPLPFHSATSTQAPAKSGYSSDNDNPNDWKNSNTKKRIIEALKSEDSDIHLLINNDLKSVNYIISKMHWQEATGRPEPRAAAQQH